MRKIVGAVGSLLMAMSFQASATTVNCFSCTNLEVWTIANDAWSSLAQNGPMYIVDARNGVVRKFQYRSEWTGNEDDPYNAWIEEAPVEQNIVDGIAYAGGLIRAAGVEVIHADPNHPNLPSDVYQLIQESHFEDDINTFINMRTDANQHNMARSWLNGITNAFFSGIWVQIAVKFVMKDGSYVWLKFDNTHQKWVREEGTERDRNGNKVPLNINQIANQTYVFPDASIGAGGEGSEAFFDMMHQLQNMGVTVVDASYGQSVTYKLSMSCTPTTCTFWYVPM